LLLHAAANVPDELEGDPARLRQVLVNLLNNAISFTERGEVVVSVEMTNHDSNANSEGQSGVGPQLAPDVRDSSVPRHASAVLLRFTVSDPGTGIPPERQALLFEGAPEAGPGLGLAIARHLVERLGGRIWAESVVGKGSTFHFTVRLTRPAGVEPPAPVPEGL